MGKIGFQKYIYQGFIPPSKSAQNMDRFLYRSQSPASHTPTEPTDTADLLAPTPGVFHTRNANQRANPTEVVTVPVLDLKLQTLLQDLTRNIAKEVGKIAQELRGEIDQLGELTATLETKFDELYNTCMHWRKKMNFLSTRFPKYNFNKKIWRIENVFQMCGSVEFLKPSMIMNYGRIYLTFLSRWP